MIEIAPKQKPGPVALFYLGFRPFFLVAALFALVGIGLWVLMYGYAINPPWLVVSPSRWHAHEMIYGYSLVVVVGFLLTAVKNWTGRQTLKGGGLALLVGLWIAARVLFFSGDLIYLFVCEALFYLVFLVSVLVPIIGARQWHQSMIVAILFVLATGNALFYAGVWYFDAQWQAWGIEIGLYTILLLILFMARRVVPFFIEKAVDEPVTLMNYAWIDVASVVLFVFFAIADIAMPYGLVSVVVAGMLFVLLVSRLWFWHTRQQWRKPLLWILYVAYAWIVFGFGLKTLSLLNLVPEMLAIHAFAFGGIGLMTTGMMARVSLGHTGRNVAEPPILLWPVFILLTTGALIRVVFPLLTSGEYRLWILISAGFWMAGFLLFLVGFLWMWLRPRVDGLYG